MKHETSRMTRTCTAMLLACCLVAGLLGFSAESAYAASSFSTNSPFGNTGRTKYTHNSKYSGYLIASGVDVSAYQSSGCDWTTAKKNNVDFAIMRVTWTGYTKSKFSYKNNDSSFAKNYKNAKKAGLMVGAYVFSQATSVSEAKKEASNAIARLKALGIGPEDLDLPIYMDYEYAGPYSEGRLYGISKSTATKCAKAFCDTIKKAGYEAGIYANTSFFKSKIDESGIGSNVDLWCAQYYSKCQSDKSYSKWQFSSTALINGIYSKSTGKVGSADANFWYIKRAPKSSNSKNIASCSIYGATSFNYTGKIITPKFEVYNGKTKLKQGTDYTIGYINNISKGSSQAYAYIRGIGDYSGYALVPFTIGSGYISHIGLGSCKTSDGFIFQNATEEEETTEATESAETATEETTETGETAETGAAETGATENGEAEALTDEEGTAAAGSETGGEIDATDTSDETATTDETDAEAVAATATETATAAATSATATSSSKTNYNFSIGSSYIRNVKKMTVSQFLSGLEFKEGYENYKMAVINTKGKKLSGSRQVETGMMLGIYNESGKLIGTADIAVNGDNIKDRTGKDLSRPLIKASLSTKAYYYDGKAKKPSVTAKYNGKTIANAITSSTGNVGLSYASGRKLPGTYKVTVTGKRYPGVTALKFKIKIKPTTIKKLKAKKNGFTLTATKQASKYVTGYQLRYSTKSDMSNSQKVMVSSSNKKVTKTIKKLKSNKTYYVQVRTYKKINGKKYYSGWSKIQTVKTK